MPVSAVRHDRGLAASSLISSLSTVPGTLSLKKGCGHRVWTQLIYSNKVIVINPCPRPQPSCPLALAVQNSRSHLAKNSSSCGPSSHVLSAHSNSPAARPGISHTSPSPL